MAERFSALRAGLPDDDPDLGPIISAKQQRSVEAFIARAKAEGVPVIAEGRGTRTRRKLILCAPDHRSDRCPANALANDEVFGPVLAALPFEDEAEALALANGTEFGLVAGVWTRDTSRAVRMARRVRAGQVYINAYGAGGGIEQPFGECKKSGHGREKGFEALYEFSALKTIVIKHG